MLVACELTSLIAKPLRGVATPTSTASLVGIVVPGRASRLTALPLEVVGLMKNVRPV